MPEHYSSAQPKDSGMTDQAILSLAQGDQKYSRATGPVVQSADPGARKASYKALFGNGAYV